MHLYAACAAVLLLVPVVARDASVEPSSLLLLEAENREGAWRVLRDGGLGPAPCPWADVSDRPGRGLRIEADLPGEAGTGIALPGGGGLWHPFTHLSLQVFVPSEAPSRIQVIVYLRDADLYYYQHVRTRHLPGGAWTDVELDLTDGSQDWEPAGHYRPWDGYCRQGAQEFGVKFVSEAPYGGLLFLDRVRLERRPEALPARNAIYNLRANAAEVGRYDRFELSFNLARIYENPFDPEEINVSAVITCPDGSTVRAPGFFYQGFLRRKERGAQVLVPMGRSQWKVRFAPLQLGAYQYQVEVDDGEVLRSDVGTFRCVKGASRGFVRTSRADPDYLELDDGTFYFPIGHNIAAVHDDRARAMGVNIPAAEGTYAFDRFLERMAAAGENFGRVWMSPWSFGIEWTKAYNIHYQGLGRYNLHNAWCLDHVVEAARKHGIYLMLLFTAHGELGEYESDFFGGDREQRQGSPYWSRYGGPLDNPLDIYDSAEALKFYKRKVRYIAARWGYATSIMAWEVLNEPDLAFGRLGDAAAYGQRAARFVSEVFQHLGENDPAGHLTTSGMWRHMSAHAQPTLALANMDLFAGHIFSENLGAEAAALHRYLKQRYGKLLLITEADITPFAQDPDLTARIMRQALWTSYVLPLAGTACPWWWVLIDQKDLYGDFAALAAFAKGEDRRGMGYASAAALAADKAGGRSLQARCLRSNSRAFCWVWDPACFSQHAVPAEDKPEPAEVRIPNTPNGFFTVQVWDTRRGTPIATLDAEARDGVLQFDLPPFTGDIACKAWRKAE